MYDSTRSRHRIPLVFLLPALVLTGCSTPQTGAEAPFGLSAELLPESTTISDMTIVAGDTRTDLGTARREMQRTTIDGRRAIQFVLVQDLRQGSMYDTLWVDASTLLPIKYTNVFGDVQSIEMQYGSDGHVVSNVTRGDVVTGVDTVLTGPYLDQAEFSMLIPALPLTDGYTADLPVFHYENGAATASVKVLESHQLDHGGRTRDVWIVEVNSGIAVTRHSVDKETRDVLRVDVDLGPDRRFEQIARSSMTR